MKHSPSYYRARVDLIDNLIAEANTVKHNLPSGEHKLVEADLRLLRNGFIPEKYDEEQLVLDQLRAGHYSDEPLTFFELTRYSTYFTVHPENIAGKQITTTSNLFPITVRGTKQDVIQTIKKHDTMSKLELEAMALEIELQLLRFDPKSTSTLNGLGALGELVKNDIGKNIDVVKSVLKKSKNQRESKSTDKLTFDNVVKSYNKGISHDEIVAWVWYKQSLGVPMKGWEKYFLDSDTNGEVTSVLVTTKETVLRDNHFRELYSVPKGKSLGRPTKKTLKYDKNEYLIFRDAEGLKYVNKANVELKRTSLKVDKSQLDKLVKNGALFYLNGELLPYPIYAYGNMYDRELELRESKEYILSKYGKEVYDRHEKLILENRPTTLTITNPDPKERPKILAISDFARSFKIEELREEFGTVYDEKKTLDAAFKDYLSKVDQSEFNDSSSYDIKTYYLDARRVTNSDLTKEQKREVKTNARNEGELFFEKFLHEALIFEDQQKLDLLWNRTFNGQSSLAYHKVPVGFEASAKFKQFNLEIRPAQREGIAFMEALGSGVIAYDVGVGKTMTAIITLANAIQNGKTKRPLIVVPNPTYKKWIQEIVGYKNESGEFVPGVLSNTGIQINDWYNLNKTISSNINFSKPVAEKSITIVTYEGFKKIGFSERVMDDMFVELTNILAQSKARLKERDLEIEYQKYREKIGVGVQGTIADIDSLGLDYIVIDEAHRCKNIFDTVKADQSGNKRFGLQGRTSETGIKAFFLCNYLQRTYGRNVCLLTATPFTNSPLEIFSMLSLVARYGMQKMGLSNIKNFFEQFVLETTEMVVNQREEIVPKDVIKGFNNRLVLQKLIYNHINYKTGEEAGVKRPCKINLPKTTTTKNGRIVKLKPKEQLLTYLNMTPLQRENQNRITAFARAAAQKKFSTADLFKALSYSLNNALSPFLFDGQPEDYKEYVEESPKIKYTVDCIASVKKYHEDRNESVSGQVIYMNRGKDYFPFIKEYLEREVGYKSEKKWGRYKVDEVEIISSGMSATKKEKIKEAFLAGVVKVIIGTATIREGIDLQTKGTVIYNCYPDWNPTDLRQLEGRIWRQGNEFAYVRVAMPLVQDSMDVFVFQKLEEKTARINDIWYRGDRGNVLDIESLDPEEVKFALITDVEALANLKHKRLLKEQHRVIDKIESKIKILMEFHENYQNYEINRKKCLEVLSNELIRLNSAWQVRKTKQDLKAMDKDQRAIIERYIDTRDQLVKFFESTPQIDREILRLGKKLEKVQDGYWSDNVHFYRFKEFLAIVKKAQRTILKSESVSDDEVEEVLYQYNSELNNAMKELTRLNSQEFMTELKREIEIKKSALQVDGKTIDDRVKEFASLNYLLSFKFDQNQDDSCIIPSKENERPASDLDDLELEALALEIELELLSFAA